MKCAYVTAITNERYLPGLRALKRSLDMVNSQYPLVVLIPDSNNELEQIISQDKAFTERGGVIIERRPSVVIPNSIELKQYYWGDTFFKLQAASLYNFDKIILLDCDQMTVRNIDHLFDCSHMTGTTCGRCVHPDWLSLSSGLLVIEPKKEFYDGLINCMPNAIRRKYANGLNAGDQDVFQEVMPEWKNRKDLYLPEKYNICWGWIDVLCKKENVATRELLMIHFPGKEKPWDYGTNYWIRILISYTLRGKWEKLLFKVSMWRKYRILCK